MVVIRSHQSKQKPRQKGRKKKRNKERARQKGGTVQILFSMNRMRTHFRMTLTVSRRNGKKGKKNAGQT